jgi:hypothetical protein
MPATNAETESGGFTAEERAAMKERAAELRAEGKQGGAARTSPSATYAMALLRATWQSSGIFPAPAAAASRTPASASANP